LTGEHLTEVSSIPALETAGAGEEMRRPRILLVVDDATLSTSYRSALCVEGFEVDSGDGMPTEDGASSDETGSSAPGDATPPKRQRHRPAKRPGRQHH
jgi:hypothetical protein